MRGAESYGWPLKGQASETGGYTKNQIKIVQAEWKTLGMKGGINK